MTVPIPLPTAAERENVAEGNRNIKFLAVGESCKAIFFIHSRLKIGKFDSTDSKQEGP